MFTIFVAMIFLPLFNSSAPTQENFDINNILSNLKKDKNGLTANFHFNLSYNLTDQVTWNIKEIYLALIASWIDDVGKQEQIIWDKVIFYKDFNSFTFQGLEKSKYTLEPIGDQKLSGAAINFSFYVYKISFGGLFKQYTIPANVQSVILKE